MSKLRFIFILSLCFFATASFAHDKELNLYIWSNYIPHKVIKQFENETGIKVNVSEYDSNETMYAKLRASPRAGYDLVLPSSYLLQRMIKQGMLQKIDAAKLSNFKNLNPVLVNKAYDPANQYSIPYVWGTTGIAVNSAYIKPSSVSKWQDLWQPRFKNRLLMLDDIRDVFSMALIKLGYSVNDTNPEHIKKAYLALKALLPNIRIFNSDIEQNIYVDEDAVIGMGYNGDVYLGHQVNKNIHYIYPRDGFVIWVDCLAMPKYARNIAAAHEFLNFLMRPEIAKEISMAFGYSTPNLSAVKLLPPKIRDNPLINPDSKVLARGQFQTEVDEVLPIYEKYWEKLKIGG